MTGRAAGLAVVVATLVLVAAVGPSSIGARRQEAGSLDLLASAQPTAGRPVVADAAVDQLRTRGADVKADVVATTSAACDGCDGDSTALQVLYVSHADRARLDNSAVAWTQGCAGCSGTALAVQVVVVDDGAEAWPNNRALAVNAACTGCRTAAAAFQVVVMADRARRLSAASLAALRSWMGEQHAALRASIGLPPQQPAPSPTPEPTAGSSPQPTTGPSTGSTTGPTSEPTSGPTDPASLSPGPTDAVSRPHLHRSARRASALALNALAGLVAADLDADTLSADVDLAR